MKRWWRDPLAGFLLAGILLFVVYRIASQGDDGRTIEVGDAELLEFVQYRQRSFDAPAARLHLDGLTDAERASLVDEYIREEALVREARAMGLAENDFVIRQRLIQKLEFISRGIDSGNEPPGERELRDWYESHPGDYGQRASASFAHVFVAGRQAPARAAELLEQLNRQQVAFADAASHGDRFLYHPSYANRSLDEIASHFGPQFAVAVGELDADPERWQGPLESRYGLHLVLLVDKADERTRPFDEVRELVAYDVKRQRAADNLESLIDDIVARYSIVIHAD